MRCVAFNTHIHFALNSRCRLLIAAIVSSLLNLPLNSWLNSQFSFMQSKGIVRPNKKKTGICLISTSGERAGDEFSTEDENRNVLLIILK